MQFHSAFERCVSRVLYKSEWATARPAIMKHNGWDKCSSEVMIRCDKKIPPTGFEPVACAFGAARSTTELRGCHCGSTPRRFGKTFS